MKLHLYMVVRAREGGGEEGREGGREGRRREGERPATSSDSEDGVDAREDAPENQHLADVRFHW